MGLGAGMGCMLAIKRAPQFSHPCATRSRLSTAVDDVFALDCLRGQVLREALRAEANRGEKDVEK